MPISERKCSHSDRIKRLETKTYKYIRPRMVRATTLTSPRYVPNRKNRFDGARYDACKWGKCSAFIGF